MAGRATVERRRALDILLDVRGGAHADASFARRAVGLVPRERAFLMELAYGAIRWRGRLDWHLGTLLEKELGSLPAAVVSILELGAYQILFMNGVPPWSAVDESVKLAPGWAAGLVNGVLRNLLRRREDLAFPDPAIDRVAYLAARHSHPRWLVARWLERLGLAATEALLARDNEPPDLHLAVNERAAAPRAVLDAITAAGHVAEPHPQRPGAIVMRSRVRPVDLPGWAEGHFWVQDAGAQWVAAAADPPAGPFLDACAAPGGKLCGLLARGGQALALDADPARLALVRENCARLGFGERWIVAADARRLPTARRFALVLADVPCSGTGVLRRRIDARWRIGPEDLTALAALQRAILDHLAEHVLPGGTLLYATCSLEPEENEQVVAGFLQARRSFRCDPVVGRVPEGLTAGPYLATRPWTGDHDGMFAARLVREAA